MTATSSSPWVPTVTFRRCACALSTTHTASRSPSRTIAVAGTETAASAMARTVARLHDTGEQVVVRGADQVREGQELS